MEVGLGQPKSAGAGDSSGYYDTDDGIKFVSSQTRLHKSIKCVVFILIDAVKYASHTICCFHSCC